ncbi:MFS4B-like protein [Mya arenaria]|uniref:MFS4B-like protein n=1 Tax=Mya arenaria TaxID=6604 RepID=A0ABY7EUY9_MYAAR|nr:sodium-dependent glucose transporter 1-like [Mya arenaria]WAR12929.1 MFS4B-like protein [Mya arenaria]
MESGDLGKQSGLSRLIGDVRTDKHYRRKFLLTCALCWSYVMLGWLVLQVGPALPALQTLVSADLESAAAIFTTWSIGFIAGSFLSGLLYDRCRRLFLLVVCTLGAGTCTLMTPYTRSLPAMLAVRVLSGIFCGGLDTGANTVVSSIWDKDAGPYMQALYLAYTVGGVASPFVTRPFMSDEVPREGTTDSQTRATTPATLKRVDKEQFYGPIDSENVNYSFRILQTNTNWTRYLNSSEMNNPVLKINETQSLPPELNNLSKVEEAVVIQYAFIITSVLLFLSAIPFLAMIVSGKFITNRQLRMELIVEDGKPDTEEMAREKQAFTDVTLTKSKHTKLEGKQKIFLLILAAGVHLMYNAAEDSFGDFIISFCLDYLYWDNTQSVILLSLYWLSSCIGGIAGIFLVRILGSTKLLIIAHLAWLGTFMLASLASVFKIDILIWISMPVSGFFMVHIVPAAFTWTSENICPITGKVSSLFLIATGVGIAANPTVIGYLMEEYTYVALMYVLTVEAFLSVIMFLVAVIASNRFRK